ncbi:MAG: GNAT family N-acetyltransferase [Candidatus Heimdallarchaeota archaeon]|nr:GNAT family N-acetyltransferase [Candidatus Heimdallarchaeota archaeon]
MSDQVDFNQLLKLFEENTSIKYLRSYFKLICTDERTKAWIGSDSVYFLGNPLISVLNARLEDDIENAFTNFNHPTLIIVPHNDQNADWEAVLKYHFTTVIKKERWSTFSDDLDKNMLEFNEIKIEGFELRELTVDDEHLFTGEMGRMAYMTYISVKKYLEKSIGYGIIDLKENMLVSYCIGTQFLDNEYSIDIRTRNLLKYRQRGFAKIVAKNLINHVLDLGGRLSWDAVNSLSKDIGVKLGFQHPNKYYVYYVEKDISRIQANNG